MVLPAVCGSLVLLAVSRRGVYVSHDGLAYVGTARNLLDGAGLTPPPGSPPLGNFPPLFALALAAVGWLGPGPLEAARWLNPLLAGATALLVAAVVWRRTGSALLAAAGGTLVASGLDMLAVASSALSEPLFVFLATAGLVTLPSAIDGRGRARWAWLLAAAALLGAATLTRYVGVTFVVAGACALAFALARTRRWAAVTAFTVVGLAPLTTWFVWLQMAQDQASVRPVAFHPPDADYFLAGASQASTWLLPRSVPFALRALAGLALIVTVAVLARRRRAARALGSPAQRAARALGSPAQRAARALGSPSLFASGAYLGLLLADRFLLEVTGRLDARFLLPLHVLAVIAVLARLKPAGRRLPKAAAAVVAVVVAAQVAGGGAWARRAVTGPQVRPGGFSSPAWTSSSTVAALRGLADSRPVYSNAPDVVYFHTGRAAKLLPETADFFTGRANPAYTQEVASMRADLADRGGLIAYFEFPARRVFLPTPRDLTEALGLVATQADSVGTVLLLPSRP